MTDSSKPDSAPKQSIENIIGERVFAFNGRYGRRKFWLWSLLLPVFMFLLLIPLASMSKPTGGATGPIALLMMALPLLFLHSKLIVHRLHDLGRSGRWFPVFTLLPILMLWESFAVYDRIEQSYEAQQAIEPYVLFMLLGSFALFFGGFLVMGSLPGTQGPNEYGPDPLGEQKSECMPST